MANDDGPRIVISESGLSAPLLIGPSNAVEAGELGSSFDVLRVEAGEAPPQFRGKVFRVMDDQLFVVDPGSPPPLSTT
jgi:hypothetical protein